MIINDLSQVDSQATGCLPRTSIVGEKAHFPVMGTVDDCPMLPRSDWQECSIRHQVWELVDQNPQKSCCPSAVRGSMEILREIAGCARVSLSQGSLYGRINNGRDGGANIESALESMMEIGMTTKTLIDEYDWDGKWPNGWEEEAKRFRILEAFDCPNFDAVASAVQRGIPVVFGVYWGRGGHAITATGLKKVGSGWSLEFLNSWGEWGDNGFGLLAEKECSGIKAFGAFAIRSVTIPTNEELPPILR